MKRFIFVLLFLVGCSVPMPFEYYRSPQNARHDYYVGCITRHRCFHVANQICGAAGFDIKKEYPCEDCKLEYNVNIHCKFKVLERKNEK